MRIAIIGTGIIGKSHFNSIMKSDGCSLASVADIDIEKAKTLVEGTGVPYYSDYKEMCIKEKPDAVIVNLPHFLHKECGVFCLENGIDVLMEKPMANTSYECDQLIQAADKSGSKLAIAHPQRYFAVNRKVRSVVQSGNLGKLRMMTETRNIDYFNESRPRWFLNRKLSGGGIAMNYGVHALDKFLFISGGTKCDVMASSVHTIPDYDVEAGIQLLVNIDDHISATLCFCGYKTPPYYLTSYYFENGAIHVEGTNKLSIFTTDGIEPIILNEDKSALEYELEDFLKYVRGENSDIPLSQYSKRIIECIEKAYKIGEI